MIVLKVPDMTCGHCASTVRKAVADVDPAAAITVDLTSKKVSIESNAGAAALSAAIREAGYANASV